MKTTINKCKCNHNNYGIAHIDKYYDDLANKMKSQAIKIINWIKTQLDCFYCTKK